MVKVFEGTEDEFYMDGYLQSNLDIIKEVVKKDWDMVIVVDGTEGVGKSVLAQQMAKYCDPTFNINRICFSPESFEKTVVEADKYTSVVFDEAFRGLSSRETMTSINRMLVKMFAEIRQKNLFVFVVMPTYFDLDKYVALWRSRALIHVYDDKFKRGFFMFFNKEKKKDLYVLGKKYYSYSKVKSNFRGRFYNHYTVNEIEYRDLKNKALNVGSARIKIDPKEIEKEYMLKIIKRMEECEPALKINQKIKILDCHHTTYYKYRKSLGN